MKPPAPDHRYLAAATIDLADRTYFFSPEREHPAPHLVDSIREYGLLHPPLLQQRGGDRFIVIAGWKRLAAAITVLQWDTVPCIVAPADCPDLHLHALLLEQSLLGKPLSAPELSGFFANLCTICGIEDVLPLLAKLGYKPNRHQLDELLDLRNLSESALLALHRGILSSAGARKLLRLVRADQETLVAMIARFQLGGSKQQKLIELCTELLHREHRSVEDITAPFLEELTMSRQMNIPQQAAALLSWLHGQCCPRSGQAESEFSRRVAQLNLPTTMQVDHSSSFEEDSVTLRLKFTDWEALQNALPDIRKLVPAK
ncbi:MAG: ParB/RepB/Spo0J family partition protein [Desulfobulbaceae bacterium]